MSVEVGAFGGSIDGGDRWCSHWFHAAMVSGGRRSRHRGRHLRGVGCVGPSQLLGPRSATVGAVRACRDRRGDGVAYGLGAVAGKGRPGIGGRCNSIVCWVVRSTSVPIAELRGTVVNGQDVTVSRPAASTRCRSRLLTRSSGDAGRWAFGLGRWSSDLTTSPTKDKSVGDEQKTKTYKANASPSSPTP